MKSSITLLPNFLILGATKAGTTTLYAALKKHPEIYFPFKKEMHFFNNDIYYSKGVDWYVKTYYKNSERYKARGDATPAYLYWGEKVIPRLQECYGDKPPKMVIILRDPVERAYSFYWHNRRSTKEELSFEEALRVEEKRMELNREELYMKGKPTWAYFKGSLYSEQLELYFDHFPRKLFHIMLLDDIKQDFIGSFRNLFDFLGVDPEFNIQPVHSNQAMTLRKTPLQRFLRSRPGIGASVKKALPLRLLSYFRKMMRFILYEEFSYESIKPQTEQLLRERFTPDIKRLETLINRDLSTWYHNPGKPSDH